MPVSGYDFARYFPLSHFNATQARETLTGYFPKGKRSILKKSKRIWPENPKKRDGKGEGEL